MVASVVLDAPLQISEFSTQGRSLKGTRPLTTTKPAAYQRVSLRLWGPPAHFRLGTFTASWFSGWLEFPVAVHGPNDAYWKKFEIIAECETHDAGEIRLGEPLEPLLDKICEAISEGCQLLDWRTEKTYITFKEVLAMSTAAELSK